jgi:probable O-glycosylation ligase (exosortase A-associated)
MRDIALAVLIFGLLPAALVRPHVGILMWTWFGLMNPHRLTFGWAYDFPFALIIGIVTMLGIAFSRERKRLPLLLPVVALLAFDAWMVVTSAFSLFPSLAWPQLEKVAKIQLFIFLTIVVMQSRERIRMLVWVSALSIAYFGIKGGMYTILRGGHGMVLGPDGGFIAGNTEISLALTMTLPMMRWLQLQTDKGAVKWLLGISMALIAVAILGSYSRGGFLALFAMGAWFWFKGNKKIAVGFILLVLVPAILAFMPAEWWQKMGTIQTFEENSSALARLNSWGFAWNLALAKPIVGGGLQAFQPDAFTIWAPDPTRVWDAHSIWFSVLAEHGFVGLALYLLTWVASWRMASRIIRDTSGRPDLRWAGSLAAMIQVSFIGYWVGGAFLSLSYWDYPYILLATLVLTHVVVQRESAPVAQTTWPPSAAPSLAVNPRAGRKPGTA